MRFHEYFLKNIEKRYQSYYCDYKLLLKTLKIKDERRFMEVLDFEILKVVNFVNLQCKYLKDASEDLEKRSKVVYSKDNSYQENSSKSTQQIESARNEKKFGILEDVIENRDFTKRNLQNLYSNQEFTSKDIGNSAVNQDSILKNLESSLSTQDSSARKLKNIPSNQVITSRNLVNLSSVNTLAQDEIEYTKDLPTTKPSADLGIVDMTIPTPSFETTTIDTSTRTAEFDTKSSLKRELKELKQRISSLSNFMRLNAVGLNKILKKHDKVKNYKLRPKYRPLLKKHLREVDDLDLLIYKISKIVLVMSDKDLKNCLSTHSFVRKTSKYWVHKENLAAVKCLILNHLPVYVHTTDQKESSLQSTSNSRSKSSEQKNSTFFSSSNSPYANWDPKNHDTCISSIYLDNSKFDLYTNRLLKTQGAEAIRIRWYGSKNPDIVFIERKRHEEDWTGDKSAKLRFKIPENKVNDFLNGKNVWSFVEKLNMDNVEDAFVLYNEVRASVLNKKLQPSVRTFYKRTAFQLPHSAEVRVSLDTHLCMIKEKNTFQSGDKKNEELGKMNNLVLGGSESKKVSSIFPSCPQKSSQIGEMKASKIDQDNNNMSQNAVNTNQMNNQNNNRDRILDNLRDNVQNNTAVNTSMINQGNNIVNSDSQLKQSQNTHYTSGFDPRTIRCHPDSLPNERYVPPTSTESIHKYDRFYDYYIKDKNEPFDATESTLRDYEILKRRMNLNGNVLVRRDNEFKKGEYDIFARDFRNLKDDSQNRDNRSNSDLRNYLNPFNWKREDVDCDFPFTNLKNEEIVRFPYAILEIKLQSFDGEKPGWIEELINSDLIEHVDKFSKFMHGTAVLYPEIETIPYWLPQMHKDITKYELRSEQDHNKFTKHTQNTKNLPTPYHNTLNLNMPQTNNIQIDNLKLQITSENISHYSETNQLDFNDKRIAIPVRVEPKVFFANERTFLSWLHFSIFIGGIGTAMMGLGDSRAVYSGVVFILVSVLFAIYALYLYFWRAGKIRVKDPGPYDDLYGPAVLVCVFLTAMGLSVFFKMRIK